MHQGLALDASRLVVIVSLALIWLCCCYSGRTSNQVVAEETFDPIWSRPIHRNGARPEERSKRNSGASVPRSFVSPKNCGTCSEPPPKPGPATSDSSSSKRIANRISSGIDLEAPTSWPFFGTLMGESGGGGGNERTFCGATILSPKLAITSATCGLAISKAGNSSSSLRLTVGSHFRTGDSFRGQVVWASETCTPAEYSLMPSINGANRSQFDFMLIKFEEELEFSASLGAACVVKRRHSDEEKPEHHLDKLINDRESVCFIIAHQTITGEEVRVKFSPINKRKCWLEDHHDKLNFCFSGKDGEDALAVCQNDSGAPIFCRDDKLQWYLVGLVSTVMPDCKDLSEFGIYNVATSMSRMVATGAFQECVDMLDVDSH